MLVGHDAAVARWVGEQLDIKDFGPCAAIGICDGPLRHVVPTDRNGRACASVVTVPDGPLIAGVVYNNYRESNIEMTIASTSPHWCKRGILRALFRYPFEQIGCRRVTAIADCMNVHVRGFLSRLGFLQEGEMRRAYRNGNDAVIYGMLREECSWIGDKDRK